VIRRARVEDAPAIARIWVDAWRTSYRGLVPDAVLAALSLAQRVEHWRSRLEVEHTTLVAGEVDGYCRALPAGGEIASLYVHPDCQGRGLGGALLEAALAELPGVVTLWVFTANERARSFYARHGFEPDGAVGHDPVTGLDEIRMART
jgi:ribosomal protein S18 acetylase RimI-like enzyme